MGGKGILAAFGHVVRQARLSQQLSQEELALSAGLNRNFVMSIEAGRRKPSIITIFALAKALGISAAALLSRTEKGLR